MRDVLRTHGVVIPLLYNFVVFMVRTAFGRIICQIDDSVRDIIIIVTATAHEGHHVLFAAEHVAPGTHINALGGDGAGKTELDPALLDRADIIVQYAPQTRVEGEIQNREGIALYASVHALCEGTLHARQRDQSITLFDSVGFALEDYSALVYVLNESTRLGAGSDAALLPQSDDPKDLFAFLA